jgi:hypothetical protein
MVIVIKLRKCIRVMRLDIRRLREMGRGACDMVARYGERVAIVEV